MNWRLFTIRQLPDAYAWAAGGGIAIHHMGGITGDVFKNAPRVFKGRPFAHMFGPDRELLIEAAVSIGCNPAWIQKDDDDQRRHFDLTGRILKRALTLCVDH